MPLKSILVYGSLLALGEIVNSKLNHQYRKAFYVLVDQVLLISLVWLGWSGGGFFWERA